MAFTLQENGAAKFLSRSVAICLPALLFSTVLVTETFGQESMPQNTEAVTPLADVLHEAEQDNPQIQAARHGWKPAQQVPTQVSTLPDPQFQFQQVNVGSPRPF